MICCSRMHYFEVCGCKGTNNIPNSALLLTKNIIFTRISCLFDRNTNENEDAALRIIRHIAWYLDGLHPRYPAQFSGRKLTLPLLFLVSLRFDVTRLRFLFETGKDFEGKVSKKVMGIREEGRINGENCQTNYRLPTTIAISISVISVFFAPPILPINTYRL